RGTRPSDRKVRLFTLACCYRIKRLMSNAEAQEALEFLERHIEKGVARRKGRASLEDAARTAAVKAHHKRFRVRAGPERTKWDITSAANNAATSAVDGYSWQGAVHSAEAAARAVGLEALLQSRDELESDKLLAAQRQEEQHQAELLRCIFGNPFRPITWNTCW